MYGPNGQITVADTLAYAVAHHDGLFRRLTDDVILTTDQIGDLGTVTNESAGLAKPKPKPDNPPKPLTVGELIFEYTKALTD